MGCGEPHPGDSVRRPETPHVTSNSFSGARHLLRPKDKVMLNALGTAVESMAAFLASTKTKLSRMSPLDSETRLLAIELAHGQREYLEFRQALIAAQEALANNE